VIKRSQNPYEIYICNGFFHQRARKKLQSATLAREPTVLDDKWRESFENNRSEVLRPLLNKEVGSLLIKGEPGTGKTTLALELLALHGRGIYVSTRVSLEQLIDHQKELSTLFKTRKVVNLEPFKQKRPSGKKPHFFDSRYADPRALLDGLITEMRKIREPLIILDSWDSIANMTERTERLKVEQSITFIASGHGAKIVFLSEDPNMTTTDYLVDAVVTLKNEISNGNRIRKIEWNKLRGSPVPIWSTLYTLAGGRFTPVVSSNLSHEPPESSTRFRPTPHTETSYSTGNPDLDNFFGGGLPKRRHILFDLGRYVAPFESYNPITSTIRMNFIANGGSSLFVPSSGSSGNQLRVLYQHIPRADIEERFRVGYFGNAVDWGSCHFDLDPNSWKKSFEIIANEAQKIKGPENRPCLYTVSSEMIGHVFDHDDSIRFMQSLVQRVRHSDDVLFTVAFFGSPLIDELGSMCDIYVRVEQIEGVFVMYSVKPKSQLYSLSNNYSKGYTENRLTPLV
jgi:KaiC/GvpD/RAD55 family RecA-like ATPase